MKTPDRYDRLLEDRKRPWYQFSAKTLLLVLTVTELVLSLVLDVEFAIRDDTTIDQST